MFGEKHLKQSILNQVTFVHGTKKTTGVVIGEYMQKGEIYLMVDVSPELICHVHIQSVVGVPDYDTVASITAEIEHSLLAIIDSIQQQFKNTNPNPDSDGNVYN